MTTTAVDTEILHVALDRLTPHPANRKHFEPKALAELAENLRTHGQFTPAIVRPRNDGFQLLAGERRWRAARTAGLPNLLCIVREADDAEAFAILATENNQRENPDPLDEAGLFAAWMKLDAMSEAVIAGQIGRSPDYVKSRLLLLNLVEPARKLLEDGVITIRHAEVLSRISAKDQQLAIGPKDRPWSGGLLQDDDDADPSLFGKGEKRLKATSVKGLRTWVNENVRVDAKSPDLSLDFPAAAVEMAEARKRNIEVLEITLDYGVGTNGVLRPNEYHRADGKEGSKKCDFAVLGFVAIGPERGTTFPICVAKKDCAKHYPKKKATPAPSGGRSDAADKAREARERAKRQAEEAENARWKKAMPQLNAALKAAVAKLDKGALLKRASEGLHAKAKSLATFEDLARALVIQDLHNQMPGNYWGDGSYQRNRATDVCKGVGVDAAKVVDAAYPPAPKMKAAPVKRRAGDVARAKKAAKRKGVAK